MSDRACNHERWVYGPTLDSNPPSESRTCADCGTTQTRDGVGYFDGVRVEATEWKGSAETLCDSSRAANSQATPEASE